jgi:hypothetical protein
VKRLTLLITPDGQSVFPDSVEFRAALGDPDPDYDAIGYAVKNLGFVKFDVIEQSIVEVELHPRNVELPALLAAQQLLLRSDVRLFRIKYFENSWLSEISSSAEHTIARLSELCAPVFTPTESNRFVAEPRDFAKLFEDDENALRPIAQKWRISFGQFDPTVISLALQHQLLSRLAIVGITPPDDIPRWRFIGDAHKWMGEHQFQGIGQPVANLPDSEYGSWVSGFFKSVADSRQPRYEHVNAMIQYEGEDGKPRRPILYERLLLPWKTNSDEVFITSCSRIVATDVVIPATGAPFDSSVIKNFAKSS